MKSVFSERLAMAIKYRNITAADLSRRAGVSESQISQYLSGRCVPKQKNMEAIATALNVQISYLLGLDVSMVELSVMHESLSRDEQELIIEYRTINNVQRACVHEFIKGIIESQKIISSGSIVHDRASRQPRGRRIRRKEIKRTAL